MRPQIVLACTGSILGCLLAALTYYLCPTLFTRFSVGSGSSFENLEDLRVAMRQRKSSEQSSQREVPLRGIVIPNPSDKIIYELEPNRVALFRGQRVEMNSFGMRSPEIAQDKPLHTKRIAVLGDSYAFGWGVPQNSTFSRWLETELNRTAPQGERVEVLNFGVPGYATFQEVGGFFEKGVRFSPDVVLVYFIKNDFGLPFFIRDLNDNSSLLPAPAFDQQTIRSDDQQAQARRKALLRSLDANRALLELAIFCKERNIPVFLAPHPDESAKTLRGKLWVLKNSPGKETIRFLDLQAPFQDIISRDRISSESLSIPHDHHPGAGAHEAVGKALAPMIAPALWPNRPAEPGESQHF